MNSSTISILAIIIYTSNSRIIILIITTSKNIPTKRPHIIILQISTAQFIMKMVTHHIHAGMARHFFLFNMTITTPHQGEYNKECGIIWHAQRGILLLLIIRTDISADAVVELNAVFPSSCLSTAILTEVTAGRFSCFL